MILSKSGFESGQAGACPSGKSFHNVLSFRRGKLPPALVVFLFSLSLQAAELDALLIAAVRYANTAEKHAAKMTAREELQSRMPEAFHAAMNYIHGDNVMLQVLVMEWVEQLPSETVVPVLLDYVDDEREDTRRLAVFFLGFHDAPEYADRIMTYLDDNRCRGVTIRTLGKWKVVSSRPDIEKWLSGGEERVRVVSANALRDLGNPAAIPALIGALDDEMFTVRNTAARALISFGEQSADALKAAEENASARVKEMSLRILSDLGEIPAYEALDDGITVDGSFFIP